jgi:hypothetical protein
VGRGATAGARPDLAPGDDDMQVPPDGISRREAIRRVSLLLGGAISAPTLAGLLAGCERGAPGAAAFVPRALTAPQNQLVVALAEHILPRTDTPGATDARVNEFVDAMLADFYSATDRAKFLAGLGQVDVRAQQAYGKPFLGGTAEQQLALVTALDRETFAKRDAATRAAARDPAATQRNPVTAQGNVQSGRGSPNDPGAVSASGAVGQDAKPDPEDVDVRSFFRTLKELTLVGYYTSEVGATQELRVDPMGAWRADVPYQELGRAWA